MPTALSDDAVVLKAAGVGAGELLVDGLVGVGHRCCWFG